MQYRINRQESLTRDFSSEKDVKPQECFVYFKVLQTNSWRKRSVRIRRRICAVLPYAFFCFFSPLVYTSAEIADATGTVSTTPPVDAMPCASSMAR